MIITLPPKNENTHRIQFSDLAQIIQIHEIEYKIISIFEFLLYKLSFRDS